MPELTFQIDAVRSALSVQPALLFRLAIAATPTASPTVIEGISLRCQIRIEPARRRYLAAEQDRLLDLFGTPERWGQTLRSMLWTQVSTAVPSFVGRTTVDLPVPCSDDASVAAMKFGNALEHGDIPLCFLFNGTIFYRGNSGAIQVALIPWHHEVAFRLRVAVWQELMESCRNPVTP